MAGSLKCIPCPFLPPSHLISSVRLGASKNVIQEGPYRNHDPTNIVHGLPKEPVHVETLRLVNTLVSEKF